MRDLNELIVFHPFSADGDQPQHSCEWSFSAGKPCVLALMWMPLNRNHSPTWHWHTLVTLLPQQTVCAARPRISPGSVTKGCRHPPGLKMPRVQKSRNQRNTRTQRFPLEDCTVGLEICWPVFTSSVSGFNVVADWCIASIHVWRLYRCPQLFRSRPLRKAPSRIWSFRRQKNNLWF